jgi:hypothetical protein
MPVLPRLVIAMFLVAATTAPLPLAPARPPELDCGFHGLDTTRAEIADAVARGVIDDPASRTVPNVPHVPTLPADGVRCVTREHIFTYEDSERLLADLYDPAELYDLMVDAANALIAAHGDEFDFVGFWTNFDPGLLLGTAFYFQVSNDVLGIGDAGELVGGDPIFDRHDELGLAGTRVQGLINMWNVNSPYWATGDGDDAAFTRLTIGHELMHRFGIFLPPVEGLPLQGDNMGCGRRFHWHASLDGQGSGIEMREWVGEIGPVLADGDESFNRDNGGVFSYTDLYLMGYVSAPEMDAGNSELRYMVGDCASPHLGTITHLSSADVIAAAGPRVPDSTAAQKHFRVAWIMIHQPGDPPSNTDLQKTVGILEQLSIDWSTSTLGRGTIDQRLFADCECDGAPDDCTCPTDIDGDGVTGQTDLSIVLASWGPCPGCPADLDGDGRVALSDTLLLFLHWGPCD